MKIYTVVDGSGEYVRNAAGDKRTPASNDAYEFDSEQAAREACSRATDRVVAETVED